MHHDAHQPEQTQDPALEKLPMPLIADVIQTLNESGELTVKQFEDALGLAPRSGYHYTAGRYTLDAQQLRQLFRTVKSRKAQAALLAFLIEGSGWVSEFVESEMDINGDGKVNTSDVVDSIIQSLRACADSLEVSRAAERSGFTQMDQVDAQVLQKHLQDALQKIVGGQRVIAYLAERASRVSISR